MGVVSGGQKQQAKEDEEDGEIGRRDWVQREMEITRKGGERKWRDKEAGRGRRRNWVQREMERTRRGGRGEK